MINSVDHANESEPADSKAPPWLLCLMAAMVLWAAWWLMMASHESGHVIATLITGGGIDRVDLSPLGFSQTHSSPNPMPMLVVWAGPIVGVLDPLLAWLLVLWLRQREPDEWQTITPVITFLAGFCLLANGAYIGIGWIDHVGDTGEMLRLGTPVWLMIVFGVFCAAGGLALWHTLGHWTRIKRLTTQNARHLIIASTSVIAIGFVIAAML